MQDLQNTEEQLLQLLEQQNQTIQEQTNKITLLETKLAEAYRKIETLSESDLELQKAQQYKQSAEEKLEMSKRTRNAAELRLSEARQQESSNRQKEKLLKEQAEKLTKREKQLETLAGAMETKAREDARAELAAEREQLIKGQKALEAAKKYADRQTEETKQKAYDDVINNYEWLIKALTAFCLVVGILECINHVSVIASYKVWYAWLAAKTGSITAVIIMGVVWIIPLLGYFYSTADQHPLWMAYRLIAVIGMLMLADFVEPSTAAIVVYLTGWLIAGGRAWLSKL